MEHISIIIGSGLPRSYEAELAISDEDLLERHPIEGRLLLINQSEANLVPLLAFEDGVVVKVGVRGRHYKLRHLESDGRFRLEP